MRAQECARLRWIDIDITVGRSRIAIQDSKTPSGIRFAPISTPLSRLISTFEKKYAVGHCGVSSAYIFGSRTLPNKVYRSGEWETTLGYTHLVTADVEKAMLSDPLNYKSLNFEQILDAIEGIFNGVVKNLTHQLTISYRRDSTGLTIEVKKPVNHVPDGYTTNGSSHLNLVSKG